MIDPLVSFHAVSENDNSAMDLVVKNGFGSIARTTASAGQLFHHPGKPKQGQSETTVEDARGASAVIWAVRSARVFNFMTPAEADKLGIIEEERRRYVRIADGKANMGPIGTANWMLIAVETLPNGDQVPCSTSWKPPNPFDGVTTDDLKVAQKLAQGGAFRLSSQSPDWFGYPLAEHLRMSVRPHAQNDKKDIAKLNAIIKTWLRNNVLAIEKREGTDRRKRDFIVPA